MKQQLTIKPTGTCFKYLVSALLTVFSLTCYSAEIHDAVKEGNLEKVAALLDAGADANESDYVVGGPLFIAAGRSFPEIVSVLLERGADPNLVGESGDNTPLHQATLGGVYENIELLINASADIEKSNALGNTVLHIASMDGNLEIVKLLLKSGANINAENDVRKTTPLHLATENGHIETVKYLISKGAAIDARDSRGYSVLHHSTITSSQSRVGNISLITFLFENGASNAQEVLEWKKTYPYRGPLFEAVLEELERLSKL